MREGLKCLYKGKDALSRQVALFSLCGIFGLVDIYYSINDFDGVIPTILYVFLWIIFSMYIVGYEVIFLNERELPDINFRPFKLIVKKPLIYFLIFIIPMVIAKLFPEYVWAAFLTEMLLAVPITMIQAGYSYNFIEDEAYKLFENSSFWNYIKLFFKRILLFIGAYLAVSIVIFLIFFIIGLVLTIKWDFEKVGLLISSNQYMIERLSNFFAGIFLVYVLTITTLVWDYELIKTYE